MTTCAARNRRRRLCTTSWRARTMRPRVWRSGIVQGWRHERGRLPKRRADSSAAGDDCSPFFGIYVSIMLREQPVVPFEVLDSVLAFAITSLVEHLDDVRACGFGSLVVRVHVVNKHG